MERKDISLYTADELDAVDCAADEQEITMTAYRSDSVVDVWISDNTMLTKMKKMMEKFPDDYKLVDIAWTKDGTPAGYRFSMSKRLLRFPTPPREMSAEERAQRAANMAKMRANYYGKQ